MSEALQILQKILETRLSFAQNEIIDSVLSGGQDTLH
jgi:hypothetical protein